MNINQVSSFRIQTSADDLVRIFCRNNFATSAKEEFVFVCQNRKGEEKYKFFILESTAELSLSNALKLQEKNSDLVRVEVTKLETGTSFNYPRPFV
jgi:hypothetical protein